MKRWRIGRRILLALMAAVIMNGAAVLSVSGASQTDVKAPEKEPEEGEVQPPRSSGW